MNVTFIVGIWAVLGIATLVLAVYRIIFAAHNEEDIVRLAPVKKGRCRSRLLCPRNWA